MKDDQANKLTPRVSGREEIPSLNYFSSLLGTLIVTWWLCIQDLARLSEINPFFDFIFAHSFFAIVMEF